MDKKSGDWRAAIIQNLETRESEPQPTPTLYDPANPRRPILFSKDMGDPEMGTVLRWHLDRCNYCSLGATLPPPAFGVPDKRHCAEYWDIIFEYQEYERDYAMRGNP